jgi:glycosyltransferase involved in cell wall biosynthesis
MKITIDVRMLHSSGIGVYIQNLVPRIIRLRKQDRFCLLGKETDRGDRAWKGLPEFQWMDCAAPIYSLRQQWELKRKIPNDTDLLWVPHYDIPVFYRGKLMVTVHDLFHLAMPEFTRGIHKKIYARWMFGQATRKAGAIPVISRFTKDELIRLIPVDENKVHVIHLGVDESWFKIQPAASPHPNPYFLYVGNIKPHKNLKRLLEAFRSVQNQTPHDLLLVGQKEGFISGDADVQKEALGFGGRVRFTGLVPPELLKQYFLHAQALVFPSLYEGFGMPPLEAMACGCPVTASTAASIPEVCGEAALYFDPLDLGDIAGKMLRLAREKELREELASRGKARAMEFSWEKCAGRTSGLMDVLLAGQKT